MIASEGEQKSAKALMEAARIMASSPSALQLRQVLAMMMVTNMVTNMVTMVVTMPAMMMVFAMLTFLQVLANLALDLSGEEQHDNLPTAYGAPWRVH